VGQRIILFKELPSIEYVSEQVERGVLRAGMTFLPGSCYAGAGIYHETTAYVTSGTTSDAVAADACPYPNDPVRCAQWEILETLHKFSVTMPQEFNAFVFAQVRAGSQQEWGDHAVQVLRELEGEGAGLVDEGSLRQPEYFAVGHLVGCGPYNVCVEVVTSDHNRLQRTVLRLFDKDYVEDVMVGHVAADAAIGWGTDEAADAP
jgi:hypothetical protein